MKDEKKAVKKAEKKLNELGFEKIDFCSDVIVELVPLQLAKFDLTKLMKIYHQEKKLELIKEMKTIWLLGDIFQVYTGKRIIFYQLRVDLHNEKITILSEVEKGEEPNEWYEERKNEMFSSLEQAGFEEQVIKMKMLRIFSINDFLSYSEKIFYQIVQKLEESELIIEQDILNRIKKIIY